MKAIQLEALFNSLNSGKPPMDLSILEAIKNLDWVAETEEELEWLCEILIRTGVDAIMCAHELKGQERDFYEDSFKQLRERIDASSLPKLSAEFASYFTSFKDYLADF